ncbi:23898_t:CDS:2, partial [Gigaspora margarita]
NTFVFRAKPNNKVKADPKGNGNCQPGTVIDKDIVVPQYFNFYLQSHSSLTGTAIPAYYHVFYDEVGFSQDEMQTLTYNLCFLSPRFINGTPLHYAHKLAKLVKSFTSVPATVNAENARKDVPINPKHILNREMYYVHDNIKNT